MIFKNLTGSVVRVLTQDGTVELKPENWKANVDVSRETIRTVQGMKIARRVFGNITGVPDEKDGVCYVVSKQVGEALKMEGRSSDILIPDDMVRNGSEVLGCKYLSFA